MYITLGYFKFTTATPYISKHQHKLNTLAKYNHSLRQKVTQCPNLTQTHGPAEPRSFTSFAICCASGGKVSDNGYRIWLAQYSSPWRFLWRSFNPRRLNHICILDVLADLCRRLQCSPASFFLTVPQPHPSSRYPVHYPARPSEYLPSEYLSSSRISSLSFWNFSPCLLGLEIPPLPHAEFFFRSVVFDEIGIMIPPIGSIADCRQNVGVSVPVDPICVPYRPDPEAIPSDDVEYLDF